MNEVTRRYERHTTTIPLEFKMGGTLHHLPMQDIAEGGICFVSGQRISTGKVLHLFIQTCQPNFDALVMVEWCKKVGTDFLVGVSFRRSSNNSVIRKLVEQLFYIEDYCSLLGSHDNIAVTRQHALKEWLEYNQK